MADQWHIPRRQPPAALFLVLYKAIIQLLRMLWPVLLIWILRSPGREAKVDPWEIGIGVFSLLLLINSVLAFYTFRFYIEGEDLLVKKGVFVRRQIVLPLHRIQAVHIEENWLHQLLDLAQVAVDSPGTEQTEMRITMRKMEAEAFRQFISGQVKQKEETDLQVKPVSAADKILFQLSTSDLVKLGLSANHLEAFFLMLAFGISTLENLERAIDFKFSGFLRSLTDVAASSTAAAIGMAAIAILILSMVFSILRIALQYGRFVISETEKGFRIQSGLINLKEKLIPFNKVQYISWKANWIRSKLPIYLLHFHAIGDANMKKKWTIRVPITQTGFIEKLLAYYHTAIDSSLEFIRVNTKYVLRRFWMAGLLPSLMFFGIGYFFWKWRALIVLLLPAYTLLASWLFQKKFRLYTDTDALQIHQGVFGKEFIVLRWENIQSVSVRQGIYQRRHQLATLRLYTADKYITIPFISLSQAEAIRDYAIYKIEVS